jgi:hypothetical protein
MRTNEPSPAMILERGQCKAIWEATCDAADCSQEALPDAFKILLCMIDGAERRRGLMTKWISQDDPAQDLDSDEGLEAILCRELMEIARSNGVSDPKPLLT